MNDSSIFGLNESVKVGSNESSASLRHPPMIMFCALVCWSSNVISVITWWHFMNVSCCCQALTLQASQGSAVSGAAFSLAQFPRTGVINQETEVSDWGRLHSI